VSISLRNNAMVKQSLSFLKQNYIFVLAFILLLVFSIHNFDSIGQDIGRHLKVGQTIWQTGEIPKTNLFSFTESDFPFTNHHWLSEVLFFGIFSTAGFIGLIIVKVVLILVAFLLLFFIAKKYSISLEVRPASEAWSADDPSKRSVLPLTGWPLIVSFLLSVFIFIERTEVRPEMFSFVILALFLFILFRAKYSLRPEQNFPSFVKTMAGRQGWTLEWLWFLPVLELFWVNLHIYFFIGPFLILAFLVDRVIARKHVQLKRIIAVLFLTLMTTLLNPNGIQGAFLPFKILKEYGYSIVENQTLSFLANFFNFNLSIFIFKISAVMLTVFFILTAKKARQRVFEIIISTFFIYAGFRMLRNLPLYALASFPIMAILLTDIRNSLEGKISSNFKTTTIVSILKWSIVALLVLLIFSVANNSFYKHTNSPKTFGFSVPNGLENAVNFVKDSGIEGPMFNNFDVGGYLIWQLFPQEKVFVDNRPEAYSVKFFSEIYKPMQDDKKKWLEFSEKYGINFIFFGHADNTPWGGSFLRSIVKNPDWKVVFINEEAIVLVKNNSKNGGIISKFDITDKNAVDKITGHIKNSNKNSVNLNLALANVLYNISWLESSVHFAEEVLKLDPKNSRAYLYKGLAYAYYTDEKSQKLAEENIKKAIDLGLKNSQYYSILGVVYMNLGRFESAEGSFKEALRLDKNNTQAREFINKYFNR